MCVCVFFLARRLRTTKSDEPGLHHCFHVFTHTTDRGSNELATRKLLHQLYDESGPRVLFFAMDCCEHAIHLVVMGGLAEIEARLDSENFDFKKYFAACAVLGNVLRDSSRAIFQTWIAMFGTHDALKCARTLFPKCIAGRWGSVHGFEERLLQCGKKQLNLT